MGFLAPWFLAGLAAVGLPIWLHLLKKHRSTPQPFSSLMFFEQHLQSSIKHKRLRYLMLFALRTAIFALLALAFASPFIRRTGVPVNRSGAVALLAIDNSLSMREGDRLAEAKSQAKAALGRLAMGQKAEVFTFGTRMQAMSEVTDDRAALNAAIDSVEPSDSGTSFAELARASRSIARSLDQAVSVELFSDMQQTGMPGNFTDLRLNESVFLRTHRISDKRPNFAVENVIAPRRVYDSKPARVLVTVAGYGAGKAERSVSLTLNGRVIETKTVSVPEGGRASVEFLSMDVPHGRNKGEVRIDSADNLPNDDHFYFSVERTDPKRALFLHQAGATRDLLYFKAALEAAGQSAFQIDAAAPEQAANVSPSRYAFVVLSDVGALPGGLERQLREYVRGGGSVFVALGSYSAAVSQVPVADSRVQGSHYSGREGDRFQTAGWLDVSHPAILSGAHWDEVKFYRTINIDPGNARVVAKLDDGSPLLIDQQIGDGRILVFASTFDNVSNDFPLHAAFVPFIERASRYLGRLDGGPPSVSVGSYAELRDSQQAGAAVEVLDPHGDRALSLEEGATAQNIQFTEAGFYEIHRATGAETVAVNADRRESDLTPAADETLALWRNTSAGGETAAGTTETGERTIPLWWYIMVAVLVLSVAESLLGNKHLSVDKEAA